MRFFALVIVLSFITIGGLQFNSYHFGVQTSSVSFSPQDSQNLAAVEASSFQGTVAWIQSAGYFAMFIAMLVEGPVVTAAASFAAALGFFNIWIVFILAILGDLVADFIYYAIGYFSRIAVIERYGHRFGLSEVRMKKLEHLLNTHPIKTLVFIKLAPMLSTPGLMVVGVTRMSLKEYATVCTLTTLPKVILFMLLGYYFGQAYDSISSYVQNGAYLIVFAIVATLLVYYVYQKATALISRQLAVV
jgi:membrane protein DedA with SNARE-associated domain